LEESLIDLRPHFKHYRWEPMPHSCGVPVGCDWADWTPASTVPEVYRRNGSLTMDEVAILYECCLRLPGRWLDIGGSTGWTAAHMASAYCVVDSIDPMYANAEFKARAVTNLKAAWVPALITMWAKTSQQFFSLNAWLKHYVVGALIDGCHDAPRPKRDAIITEGRLETPGVILLHDAYGEPVQEAIRVLLDRGFSHRAYPTPQGLVVCWQGDFVPPEYVQDNPAIIAKARRHYGDLAT
jgi:hypothetical protein